MDELLKKRIDRVLENLDAEQAYKVLDYVEFLQSKYGTRSRGPSPLERLADGVEDTLRVSRVPIAAIKGTREVLNTAERVMRGLADAGRSVVNELQGAGSDAEPPPSPPTPPRSTGEDERSETA